jgi:hypothetical protein
MIHNTKPAMPPLQGLGELGWTVGRNIRIDFRWGAGNVNGIVRLRMNSSRSLPK